MIPHGFLVFKSLNTTLEQGINISLQNMYM